MNRWPWSSPWSAAFGFGIYVPYFLFVQPLLSLLGTLLQPLLGDSNGRGAIGDGNGSANAVGSSPSEQPQPQQQPQPQPQQQRGKGKTAAGGDGKGNPNGAFPSFVVTDMTTLLEMAFADNPERL